MGLCPADVVGRGHRVKMICNLDLGGQTVGDRRYTAPKSTIGSSLELTPHNQRHNTGAMLTNKYLEAQRQGRCHYFPTNGKFSGEAHLGKLGFKTSEGLFHGP
ncbi:hypothetical protein SAMN06272755_1774 [Picosynechococcus sp. OG1]|nr:hypothetical protein SYNPCC7002_A2850 [Picosynechococcus sp. PCC 7002]SMH47346.1 hypothetical protein SAMN06272755_1774 [Picosynechococcus sp. OG1]SMQ80989.1 hypothetical protein SAMN06272774_1053 [Synechococcus sp. 7002]